MNTVFSPPDPPLKLSGELMSKVSKHITDPMVDARRAANADELGESRASVPAPAQSIESTGGWDAYEVWRRFIKDARERRQQRD